MNISRRRAACSLCSIVSHVSWFVLFTFAHQIITTGFKAIHLIYFFTAGEDEVKCWQIRAGTKAPGAAGTIHTDFGEGS
jgi:ribosome-binding ATPase YchF (GTP1/OBG family)